MVEGKQTSSQPRFWRTPLDQDRITTSVGTIHILAERCKGCSFCVEFCPLDVLRLSARFNLKGYHPPEIAAASCCVACHLCEVVCPEFAIFVEESEDIVARVRPSPADAAARAALATRAATGGNGR